MKKILVCLGMMMAFGQFAQAQSDRWYGEREYLECNRDVARAVRRGDFRSGREHYRLHGRYENRITDGRCRASDAPRWFSERGYLSCNRDVSYAVRRGDFVSGWHHYRAHGRAEGRRDDCRY